MDRDSLKKNEVWHIISNYVTEEKRSRIERILGILKSDDCLKDVNGSFAACKGHAECIKSIDAILELPNKLPK